MQKRETFSQSWMSVCVGNPLSCFLIANPLNISEVWQLSLKQHYDP